MGLKSSTYKIKDVLHNAGTVESIAVNTPGTNYTEPTVTIGGDGEGATAKAFLKGEVDSVDVTAEGDNYIISHTLAEVDRNNSPAGTDATVRPLIFGTVKDVDVPRGGTGYSNQTIISPSVPDFVDGQQLLVSANIVSGVIIGVNINQRGKGYSKAPTFLVSDTGGGSGAVITVLDIIGPIRQVDVVSDILSSVNISNGGTLYEQNEDVTIFGQTSLQSNAAGTATTNGAGVLTGITITDKGSDYTNAEALTVTGVKSGSTDAVLTGVVSAGSPGTNYLETEAELHVLVTQGGGAGVEGIINIKGGVDTIEVTNKGEHYTSAPVTIGDGGSGTGATATATLGGIGIDDDILQEPITITEDMVSDGGGASIRMYMAYTFSGGSAATISIINNDKFIGKLNADNDKLLLTEGYYRFDVGVEAGDNINFTSSVAITLVNHFRSHLIPFGA